MVEAAVVLPIVILCVMAVIYILVFLYGEVAAGAKMHVAANARMGEETGVSLTKKHVPHGISVYSGSTAFGKAYYADSSVRFRRSGLIRRSFTKQLRTYTYEVDEKKLIRYTDFFRRD
jgi:hypothetical protein